MAAAAAAATPRLNSAQLGEEDRERLDVDRARLHTVKLPPPIPLLKGDTMAHERGCKPTHSPSTYIGKFTGFLVDWPTERRFLKVNHRPSRAPRSPRRQ